MATITTTITVSTSPSDAANDPNLRTGSVASRITSGPDYPDPDWSATTLHYYRDAAAPPPDTANAPALGEHDLRRARRADDAPHVAPTAVRVRNIRGAEGEYSVERQGFAVVGLESGMPGESASWKDDEQLKRVFFPEVDALLKRTLGCAQTFQYEWHVRSQTLEDALAASSEGKVDIDGPVRRVHIDQSAATARRELRHYHPELAGRAFGIFNVWKPLRTVRRDPLCLCDARTLRDEELQAGKVVVPNVGEIENFAVRAPREEGGHAWAYVRGMRADEAYVFRIFDERIDGEGEGEKRSHGVAHTSFVDPGTEEEEARESIEVRSFVVF